MPSAPNTNLSHISSHPPKKMRKDKAKWTNTEEAAIITTLLEQKATRNMSESGFKPSVWPLVEFSVSKATVGDVRKNVLQCKTCYHKVSLFFGLLSCMHLLTDLPHSCIPCPRHQPTNVDTCRFHSIFTHTYAGKFSIAHVHNLILTYHLLTPIFPC